MKPRLLQRMAYHLLRNARWWLLLACIVSWYAALGLRLHFLRSEAGDGEMTIALRAWADRKSLPMSIEGHGAYFRIEPSGEEAARIWRILPLGLDVRLDGVLVPADGFVLEGSAKAREIEVDGLRLQYERKNGHAVIALTGWERSEDCFTIGKSLSADCSLEHIGLAPFAARICKGSRMIENLSASQEIQIGGKTVAPRGKEPWKPDAGPMTLRLGGSEDVARDNPVTLRIDAQADQTVVLLASEDQERHVLDRSAVVGNLQMQFTRVVPPSKADYQLLEQVSIALDQNLLSLAPRAKALAAAPAPGQPRLYKVVAAATTSEEARTAAVLDDNRVQRLLVDSERSVKAGEPENAHFYMSGADQRVPEILDVRERALSVVANRGIDDGKPYTVRASSGQSPSLEILDGPMKRTRILTDAPLAAGRCDLFDSGHVLPESLASESEVRRPPQDEPGGAVLAGRTIIFSDSGAAVLHPEVPPDFTEASRVYLPIEAGDTLLGLVRRLSASPESRTGLQARIIAANPNLDARRMRPGQRIALDSWPELSRPALGELGRLTRFPHIRLERDGEETYAHILSGPASLGGEPLEPGSIVPLRSGDRLRLGRVPMVFRDSRGVLRERKPYGDRLQDAYPMGEDSALLGGFEDRLAPLARSPRAGVQRLSLDADLQSVATSVLREHLAYIDSLDHRRYGTKGKLHAGSIVALDWKNGAILAAASLPAFDPDRPGAYVQTWGKLAASSPFLDRAFFSLRPAGSTFKLVVLAAYLEHLEKTGHLPAPGDDYGPTFSCGDGVTPDAGAILLDGRLLRCHRADKGGHGVVHGVKEALAVSCNVYFAKLALQLGGLHWYEPRGVSSPQLLHPEGNLVKSHPLFSVASRLGFDFDLRGVTPADRRQLSSIRHRSASADLFTPLGVSPLSIPPAGSIPDPIHFYRSLAHGADRDVLGLDASDGPTPHIEYKPLRHLAYLAIGQDMTISTYHLALLAATIAADGRMSQPRILADPDEEPPSRQVLSPGVARVLRETMRGVTGKGGTAPALGDVTQGGPFPFIIYAKTGTAQVAASKRGAPEERRADSLLVSFVDDPRLPPIAVAFRVENGDATRDAKGLPLPTPAKHLAVRFYAALLEMYGLWPDRQVPPPVLVVDEKPEADESISVQAPSGASLTPEHQAARSPVEPEQTQAPVAAPLAGKRDEPAAAIPGESPPTTRAPVRADPRGSDLTRELNQRNLRVAGGL